jgi:hypothetical protein
MSTLQNCKIVTNGLIFYLDAANTRSYPLSGSTWFDISRTRGSVSLTNCTFATTNRGLFSFNGSSSFGQSQFINPYAETVMVWAKSNTSTWNQFGWISASRRQNGHLIHPNTNLYGGDPRSVSFYVADSSANFNGYSIVNISDITIPHLYCYSTNGSNLHKAYVDDVLYTTDTVSISRTQSPTAQNWYLGRDDFDVRFGNGAIFVVIRYGRQLSDVEVFQNFNAMRTRFGV